MQYDDNYFMGLAIRQAHLALDVDEIPVGAVLVKDNIVVAEAHNLTRQLHNPLAHAELLLINKLIPAPEKFLADYTLYVTLEPCMMCAGTIVWSRLGRLVYGASDAKAGAVGSVYNVLRDKNFNHHPQVTAGVRAAECAGLLSEFFIRKRN